MSQEDAVHHQDEPGEPAGNSPLDAFGGSREPESVAPLTPKQRFGKFMVAAIPLLVVILYFAYLWTVSGVLPVVEKYANEKLKVTGYVKREGVQYQRTGMWTTYHPNGQEASKGRYNHGNKVPDTWHYWDENGKELPADPGEPPPVSSTQ